MASLTQNPLHFNAKWTISCSPSNIHARGPFQLPIHTHVCISAHRLKLPSPICDCSLIDGGMQEENLRRWRRQTSRLPSENSFTCLLNFPFLSKLQVQINAGILSQSESAMNKKRWRILIVVEDRASNSWRPAGPFSSHPSKGKKNAQRIPLNLCRKTRTFTLK